MQHVSQRALICAVISGCLFLGMVAQASVLVLDGPGAFSAFVSGVSEPHDKKQMPRHMSAEKRAHIYLSAQVRSPDAVQIRPLRGGELPSAEALVLDMQKGI